MKKKIVIILFALFSLLGGFFDQLLFPGQDMTYIDLALMPLFIFLIYSWYYYDSKEFNYKRNLFMNVGIVGLSLLFIPYYLFKTRGTLKGFVASSIFIAALALSWCLDVGGMYLAYYTIQI